MSFVFEHDVRPVAYVYAGPGAGERSVASAVEALRTAVPPAVQVRRLRAPADIA